MARRLVLGIVFVTLSCAGAKTTPPHGMKPAASAAASGAPIAGSTTSMVAGKAKLTPLISDGWSAFDALQLEAGKTLYVGSSGQRWIAVEQKAPTKDDPEHTKTVLTGASSMAPETLVAVRKREGGTFLFVGESGGSYVANGPLADLTTRRSPPEPLRAVAVGKEAILGVTRRDTLLRSTDGGATFAPVAVPKTDSIPTLLVASARGEALAFFSPGRFFASFDDGSTFRNVPNEGIGATSLSSAANGTLFVRGYAVSPTKPPGLAALSGASFTLSRAADGAPLFEKSKGAPVRAFRPMSDDDRLELAEGVRNGHAVFDGLRYVEVRANDDGELLHAITLEKGTITHHPPVAAAKGCELNNVAGAGGVVEFLCTKYMETKKGGLEQLHLFKSTDFGKTFVADGTLEGGETLRRIWIGAAGNVLVTGACLQTHCSDDPLLVRPANAKGFVAAKLPKGYRINTTWPIRIGGDRVYALATHEDEAGVSLLSSKDAGKTFTARPLPRSDDYFIDDIQEIAIDEKTGAVSLFSGNDPVLRLATKDDGATWDVRELSFGADWMAIAGARGLATNGHTPGVGYETLDGGTTWGVVPLPTTGAVGGTIPIVCSDQGCILGDIALREGWELSTAADVKAPPKKAVVDAKPVHLPLVECTSDGKDIELGAASEPLVEPSPSTTFALLADDGKGALDVVTWPRAGKTIARTSLLGPAKEVMATKRIQSSDGIVVLRAPRAGDSKTLHDVEVAWWVAASGKVHRATLAKAAAPAGKWGSINAAVALSPGFGLYVRIAGGTDAVTHLVRENGGVSKVTLPANFPSLQRMFARRIGAQTLFFGTPIESSVGDRVAAFALISEKNEAKTFTWGLWPRLSSGRTELSFGGDQLVLTWPGSESIAPRHFSMSLKDPGPEPPEAIAIPLTKDLAVCDGKASGPRLELAWTNGSRTPITVKQGTRTFQHATNLTIAHAGKAPCTSALLAGSPGSTGSEWTILDGDGTHGFLIARASGKPHVVAPLTCARSAAPLPSVFARARGFVD